MYQANDMPISELGEKEHYPKYFPYEDPFMCEDLFMEERQKNFRKFLEKKGKLSGKRRINKSILLLNR